MQRHSAMNAFIHSLERIKTPAAESSSSQYTPLLSHDLPPAAERTTRPDSGEGEEAEDQDLLETRSSRWRLNTRALIISMATLFIFGIALSLWSILSAAPTPDVQNGRLVQGTHGAIATENKLCSDIGKQLLIEGGSAVDAAIGATICIGTVNMYSSGLGGGGFSVVRSKDGSYETFDFREEAPASASTDMYKKDPRKAQDSGTSVAIP